MIPTADTDTAPRFRIASVGFVNARPLIEGLDADPRVALWLGVPSALLDRVRSREADVALLPVIDLQRERGLRVIPAGGIGCDGPTLTVRLFARRPFAEIDTLACDTDSHTSVALARVILARRYGVRPRILHLPQATGGGREALLLIGDKVVCEEPADFPHQLDLGGAWKEMTGLPFVFAAWCCRPEVDAEGLPELLASAKRAGMGRIDEIIRRHAVPRGWPAEVARRYLTEYLHFDMGPRQLEAVALFHRLAGEQGVIDSPPAPLRVVGT